jgi:hypothetical protein
MRFGSNFEVDQWLIKAAQWQERFEDAVSYEEHHGYDLSHEVFDEELNPWAFELLNEIIELLK